MVLFHLVFTCLGYIRGLNNAGCHPYLLLDSLLTGQHDCAVISQQEVPLNPVWCPSVWSLLSPGTRSQTHPMFSCRQGVEDLW